MYATAHLSAEHLLTHGPLAREAAAVYGPMAGQIIAEHDRRMASRRLIVTTRNGRSGVRPVAGQLADRYAAEFDIAIRQAELRGVAEIDRLEARRIHLEAMSAARNRPDLAAKYQDLALAQLGARR